MSVPLSDEQRAALAAGAKLLLVRDERSGRIYYLIDAATFDDVRRDDDLAAILEGLSDAEAGRTEPAEVVFERIFANLHAMSEPRRDES